MSDLQVKLVRSGANRPGDQKRTLFALGLRRLGKVKTYKDSPAVRGMIRKVAHLIQWSEVKSERGSGSASPRERVVRGKESAKGGRVVPPDSKTK